MKYAGEFLNEISFPLGGIGTGSIGLGGDGRLVDWEIFNRPSKGSINGYSHFAIRAIQGDKITAAVLNGDITKGYMGQYRQLKFTGYGFGPDVSKMCGFPHFKNIEFDGEFPVANLSFSDESFPAEIKMTAFNPFIPLDANNSSIPAAFFEIEVENITDNKVKYQVALSVANPYEKSRNKVADKNGYHMITMYNSGVDKDSVEYGDLTIATDCDKVYSQAYWYRGSWQDGIVSFWNDFSGSVDFAERNYDDDGQKDTGTLMAEIDVEPKEKKKVRFVLTWNVPNNYNYWNEYKDEDGTHKMWKNYYATVFEDSSCTSVYSLENWNSLYSRTMKFKDTLYNTTLPEPMVEAAASNLSVLKSPTVLRLEDGSFYGWEGVHEKDGSCEGTCQHVWNYAYAMCFLFPELERSIRDLEFKYSTDENGRMQFRMMLPIGREMFDNRACLDGQMGAVIKCYREWKISGDDEWLKENWSNIKKVLEYAWSENNQDCWDLDKDGVLEGRQHHTLDVELFGPSSWLEGIYLAALKAASEMGEYLGDLEKAEEYRLLFEKGYKWTKENLFNGKYFIQKTDVTDKSITDRFEASDYYWNDEVKQIKYQIGDGSAVDQMLAQWHADILGLGDIFDNSQISTALSEMMKNNYKPSMRYFVNPWRIFSLNDEAGTVICDYPEGADKPKIPVPYCEETMTGFEYSFAGLLCSRGRVEDGLKVVKAIRDRFNGQKRNPWNEFECGSNYARSMASYSLIPILSGFEFDVPHKYIGFKPYKTDKFQAIWSLADAWGDFKVDGKKVTITIVEGGITLKALGLKFCEKVSSLKIDGKTIDFEFTNGILNFDEITVTHNLEIEV
ncbi:MAG: GH116 family glycosyl-hydrolase [Clostridia bacterium]|nr:GH116 family glycosyl-hydrolase [Clostridia bacterium]